MKSIKLSLVALIAINLGAYTSINQSTLQNGVLPEGTLYRTMDTVFRPYLTGQPANQQNVDNEVAQQIQGANYGALPNRRYLKEPDYKTQTIGNKNVKVYTSSKTLVGKAYKDQVKLSDYQENYGRLASSANIENTFVKYDEYPGNAGFIVEPNILERYKANKDLLSQIYIEQKGANTHITPTLELVNVANQSQKIKITQSVSALQPQAPLYMRQQNNYYEGTTSGSLLSTLSGDNTNKTLQIQETIQGLGLVGQYTGVIDVYASGDQALSYFITKDIPGVGLSEIPHHLRPIRGGSQIYPKPGGAKEDVSALGALAFGVFEGSAYKQGNMYLGNIYIAHGDYLSRFVTGFGVEYNADGKGNFDWNDAGWLSHRYIKDAAGYNSDGTYTYPTILGAKYSQFDPVTTYLPQSGSVFNNTVAYKQYAVDDKADLSDLSLHARSIEAYINTDGRYSDDLLKEYANKQTTQGYNMTVRFYPDPVDLYSCKPVDAGKFQNLAEMATYADAQIQDPREAGKGWEVFDPNSPARNDKYKYQVIGKDSSGNSNPKFSNPIRDIPAKRNDPSKKGVRCGFANCGYPKSNDVLHNSPFYNASSELGICAGVEPGQNRYIFGCDQTFSNSYAGSSDYEETITNPDTIKNIENNYESGNFSAYSNAQRSHNLDAKYVFNAGPSLGGKEMASFNVFKLMYEDHTPNSDEDYAGVAPARKTYSGDKNQDLSLMATLRSAYIGANISGVEKKSMPGAPDFHYYGFKGGYNSANVNAGIDYSNSNPGKEPGRAIIYNYQPPMPGANSSKNNTNLKNVIDGAHVSSVGQDSLPIYAVESTVWKYSDGGHATTKEQNVANALANINMKLELVADDSCGSHGKNGKFYFVRLVVGDDTNSAQKAYFAQLKNIGFTANFYIHGIKDNKTGRIIPIKKEVKIITTGYEPPKQGKSGIVSTNGASGELADTIYDQVSGLVKSGSGSAGKYALHMTELDPGVAFIYRIELQRQDENGRWQRLGDFISNKYSAYWENPPTHSDDKEIRLKVARALEGKDLTDYDYVKYYDIRSPFGNWDLHYYLLGLSDDNGELLERFTLRSIGHQYDIKGTSATGGIHYDSEQAQKDAELPGEFRFVVYKINPDTLRAYLDSNNMVAPANKNQTVNGNENNAAYLSKLKEILKKMDPRDGTAGEMMVIGEYPFYVRPGFAQISSINGNTNLSFSVDKFHDINVKFDFYQASANLSSKQAHIDNPNTANLYKLSLAYELDRFGGMSRKYLLRQRDASMRLSEINAINSSAVSYKLKSPYVGTDVMLLGFVGRSSDKCDELDEHKDNGVTISPNKAINGKYGCYALPIPIKVSFLADVARKCELANQYALFRTRESTLKDDATKMAFNTASLYNIDYHCVQSYGYTDGTDTKMVYSVGVGCTTADECNKELALIKNADMNISYKDGSRLSDADLTKHGINVIVYDQNFAPPSKDIDKSAQSWCDHYKRPGSEESYKQCVEDYTKDQGFAVSDSVAIDGAYGYGDFVALKGSGIQLSKKAMNARFASSIEGELGYSQTKYDRIIHTTNNTNITAGIKSAIYEVDISKDQNAYNKQTAGFDVSSAGNMFRISVSKERGAKQELPIHVSQNISCLPNECTKAVTDRDYTAEPTAYIKYGVMSPADVVLKKPIANNATIKTNASNSNDARLNIEIYEKDGFIKLANDAEFSSAKKAKNLSELNAEVISGYDIKHTSVLDAKFVDLTSNLGYELTGKSDKASSSFIDVGYINPNDTNDIGKILRPSPVTVKFIYNDSADGQWRGVNNYAK